MHLTKKAVLAIYVLEKAAKHERLKEGEGVKK